MYSIVNLILKFLQKYTNIYNFYIQEFVNDISLINFYNFIILLVIFLIIFLKFLIQRYGVIKILIFIITRFCVAMLLFLFIYILSDFTFCQTPINKSIGQYITNDKAKYICIATMTITGCYIGYKYIPILYTNIKNYNNYKISLIHKQEYDLKYQVYLEYLKKKEEFDLNHLNQIKIYNTDCKKFNDVLQHFLTNNSNIKEQYTNFCHNKDILSGNTFLFKFNFYNNIVGLSQSDYNIKTQNFITNYNKLQDVIYSLKISNKFYIIDQELMFRNQIKLFNDIVCLFNFYGTEIIPFSKKFLNKNGELKNLNLLQDTNFTNKVYELGKTLDIYLNNAIASSNLALINSEKIFNYSLIVEPQNLTFTDIIIEKPNPIKYIEFSIENLEGFKFIGINLGYIFFYPVFYCSNKILGTINPFSKDLFYEAFKNLFFFTGFF